MSNRYYYTDPIIAVYMFENFDIHYVDEFNIDFVWGKNSSGNFSTAPERIYIADNFLHIFEPQVGDLYWVDDEGVGFRLFKELILVWDTRPKGKIIQRNDKAFFWPEVENV